MSKMRKLSLIIVLLCFFGCKKDNSNSTELSNAYSNAAVGASAHDLLSAANASSLKIEIQYMTGFVPDAGALSHFQDVLNTILNKPSGITLEQREITAQHKSTYTLDDIKAIEQQNRSVYSSGSVIGVYILIVDGGYT